MSINVRLKHKRDTAANWTSKNPVLLDGEIVLVDDDGTLRIKMGDGVTSFTLLPYYDAPMTAHIANTSNPHKVTKAQVGLGNVDDTPDASKSVNYATSAGHAITADGLTDVTATATELNVLDGITASTAELNLLDGVTATTAEINYLNGVTSAIQSQLNAKAALASPTLTGTPKAPTAAAGTNTTQVATTAFVTTAIANKTSVVSASKLTSDGGSATQPIFFENGVPKATTYSLAASVPSNAKFTDTVYTLPNATSDTLGGVKIGTNISVSSGTISVANGSTSAKGVVQLTNSTSSTSTTTAATPASVKSAYDLANSKQSPATTLSGYGITDAYTKVEVDTAVNSAKYTLPTASSTLGGVKTTSTVTSTSGLTACPIISGVPYYKDTNNTYTLSSFNVTATAAELNVLDGITATTAELNYCDGVTSNIQTQLNGKLGTSATAADSAKLGGTAASSYAKLASPTFTGTVTAPTVNISGSLKLTSTYKDGTGTTYTSDVIKTSTANSTYGHNVSFGGNGNTIVGSGESWTAQLTALEGNTGENLYLCADSEVYIKPNCNTFSDGKVFTFTTDGKFKFPDGSTIWIA